MTDFRGNIEHWIRQSEPDYYLFFLKVWIPFNAWYVAELPELKKKDSDIIKQLQDHPNSKPRKIIENFLSNTGYDSLEFQSHLAELHYYIDKNILYNNSNRLSFKNLVLTENPTIFKRDIDEKGNLYKTEKTSSYFQAYIEEKSRKVILDFKQPKYNVSDLIKDSDYVRINNKKIQNKILDHYKDIDPKKPISLVSTSTDKTRYILLKSKNTCKFINDKVTVAKGCIKILYSLRCMLFHGEVEPNNANKPIYEHAYYLLRLLLKELH